LGGSQGAFCAIGVVAEVVFFLYIVFGRVFGSMFRLAFWGLGLRLEEGMRKVLVEI